MMLSVLGMKNPSLVYNYDLSFTNALSASDRFEHVHTVAAFSGIVNRDTSVLFTPLLVAGGAVDGGSNADDIWREYLTAPGEWLAKTRWSNISSLSGLVETLGAPLKGVVLYDPSVPATSNLASTAAGCEDLLPIAYQPNINGSVYQELITNPKGPRMKVVLNLVGLFKATPEASAKIAAYRWARARWLSPGVTHPANPAKIGYYVDYWAASQGDRLKATPGLTEVRENGLGLGHRGEGEWVRVRAQR